MAHNVLTLLQSFPKAGENGSQKMMFLIILIGEEFSMYTPTYGVNALILMIIDSYRVQPQKPRNGKYEHLGHLDPHRWG
jgi:hypothetical protein